MRPFAVLLDSARRLFLYARVLWASAPAQSLAALAVAAGSAAAVTVGVVSTGQLVGSVRNALEADAPPEAVRLVWFWLAVTALVFVAGPVLSAAATTLSQAISARFWRTFYDLILDTGTAPHGVAHLEDPDFSGRLGAVISATREWDFRFGLEWTWDIVRTRLTAVGSFLVLLSWRWWAPLAVGGSYVVLARVYSWWFNRQQDNLLDVTGDERRRATYLQRLLTEAGPAKEVRIFGLADWLVDRYSTTWKDAMALVWRLRHRGLARLLMVAGVVLAANGAVFATLAWDAAAGVVTLAAIVTLVQAILALESFGPLGDQQMALARCTSATYALVRLRAELGLPDLPRSPLPAPTNGVPGNAAASIEFRDVTFTYPARDEPTFTQLSLSVPPGQSVAVVGENGAGKTTLVKLLCGLYAPDSGTVRVDGRDPAIDDSARRRIGVIFQEFVRYQLSLRRNVAVGAIAYEKDSTVLGKALADGGGASLLERLERGWETVLSPGYAGGTELSDGQWQRVALARALAAVAGGAGVLVLDEPTAALDVRAEAELFDRFLDVTAGTTTVLVSHRLSSVRHADRIVVIGADDLGRGRIIEDGRHDQLMASGGVYAQMFTLQARRFAAAGGGVTGSPDGTDEPEPSP